ncbi:MAG: hypothetical protein F6K47_16365 [Symploca sp. SIO2E6]|nr:hypothetical protein [Symploca sp. SIO2E6]
METVKSYHYSQFPIPNSQFPIPNSNLLNLPAKGLLALKSTYRTDDIEAVFAQASE